jgi:GH15 family glucan-1,4-alpha-glucosidase
MSTLPIADYALLSDCRSAALVSRAGSIDWWCPDRFDAPAVFARLLDDRAGRWALRPVGEARATRAYRDRSLVLETRFALPAGEVAVTDALALGPEERGHDLGLASPGVVLRRVDGLRGAVEMELELSPRPEYGLIRPLLVPDDGGVSIRGGADVLRLSSPVTLAIDGSTARARFTVAAGERVAFALASARTWDPPPALWTQADILRRLDDTCEAWRTWSEMHQRYDGPWRDLVDVGGRVLQGLTYARTGALVAAATTSLPERVGGDRNWDYRFTWVRDASLTLRALWVAACPDEAHRFFAWMAGAASARLCAGEHMPVMYGVGGEHDLSERTLDHLGGWRRSRPVRVGNGAWRQRQIDVYGELLDAFWRLEAELGTPDPVTARMLVAAADNAAARWTDPDHGIWEGRGAPAHHLHSKLMCWVACDRAVRLAPRLGAAERVAAWSEARDAIRAAILERGFSERAGAFTQTLRGETLDAAALTIPLTGFLPAADPRVRATIEAIAARLTDARGLVRRYDPGEVDDGVGGGEGSFLLCTFWLAHALALAGEVDRARDVFERAAGHANDLGLLAEEVDPRTGELLGNFPQAFSHVGLVDAAWAIHDASKPA